MPGINAILEQKGKLGFSKEIRIRDGQEVQVNLVTGKKKKSYRIHLLALAGKGKSQIHIAWGWVWCALISAVVLGIYLAIRGQLNFDKGIYEIIIYLACGVGIIVGLVMLVLKFSVKRVYYSRIANIPVLDFAVNKPARRDYKAFVETLDTFISKMQAAYSLRDEQQLAGEMRMLRRLASDGIVPNSAYEKAKKKLFKKSR